MKAPHGWRGPKVRDPSSQAKTKIVIFVFFSMWAQLLWSHFGMEWNGEGQSTSGQRFTAYNSFQYRCAGKCICIHSNIDSQTILNLPDSLHSFFLFLLVKLRFCETLLGSRTNNKHDMFSTCNTHTALRACL